MRLTPSTGRVVLVGAGPGAPDLLTVRAVRALRRASVVVHDGLIDPAVLDFAEAARRIDVSKRRARHTLPQDAINALLVAEAQAGEVVVRLKGGDPFVFGRGGEEVAACVAAGIAVEVIPGVSAALGAAAEALMPLTHRDHASTVSFVAGTCQALGQQDWSGLAGVGRTLVVYMGVTNAGGIADKLMADGLSPDTACAVVERGTLPGSRVGTDVARRPGQHGRRPRHRLAGASGHRRCRPARRARRRARGADMRLLTGNILETGDVVWWDGRGWSRHLHDAVDVGADGDALLAEVIAGERINDPALIDAVATDAGPRPRTMRERVRGAGPTVRRDLGVQADV